MKKVLKQLWDGWKRAAHAFGRFQTKVILTLFYFLVLSPLGAIMRVLGWDPLNTSPRRRLHSNWQDVAEREPDIKSLKRQT